MSDMGRSPPNAILPPPTANRRSPDLHQVSLAFPTASSIGPGSFTGPIDDTAPVPVGGGGVLFVTAMLMISANRRRCRRGQIVLAKLRTVWSATKAVCHRH